jgi:glycosyltransferase involved in cell wall biosynthesis
MERPLHILYIVQYFNQPDEPGGSRPYQFARHWASRGHRVTVLTSNLNHKTLSSVDAGTTEIDGFSLVRVPTFNAIRGSFGRRVVNFLSFAVTAVLRAVRIRRVDLVYASSTPLTTGLAGYAVSRLKRRPFYFEVRDLWPEAAVAAGVLRDGAFVRFVEYFERMLYRKAVKVIALSEGFRAGVIAKGKRPEDVLFVPNGMDDWMLGLTPGIPEDYPFDRTSNFICTYVGAHGRFNKLETILEAARLLSGTSVRFLLIGDGDHKDELRRYAAKLKLTNVCFQDAIPKKRVIDYLTQSHVAVICWGDRTFDRMMLPNKMFDYLAAGCPVVAAAHGETEGLIARSGGGWAVPPERPDMLAAQLREIAALPPDELIRRGKRGREYVCRHFLRSNLADQLHQTFTEAAPRPI